MNKKQKQNQIMLKAKYMPNTDRIKITQSNSKESCYIDYDDIESVVFQIHMLLEEIEEVKGYALIIDNTQNDYYLFSIDLNTNEIPNLLKHF